MGLQASKESKASKEWKKWEKLTTGQEVAERLWENPFQLDNALCRLHQLEQEDKRHVQLFLEHKGWFGICQGFDTYPDWKDTWRLLDLVHNTVFVHVDEKTRKQWQEVLEMGLEARTRLRL